MLLIVEKEGLIEELVDAGYYALDTDNDLIPLMNGGKKVATLLWRIDPDLAIFIADNDEILKLKSVLESKGMTPYVRDENEVTDEDSKEDEDDEFTDGEQSYYEDEGTGERTYMPWKRPKFPPLEFTDPDVAETDDDSDTDDIEDPFTDGQAYFKDDVTGKKTYMPWKRPKFPPIVFSDPDEDEDSDDTKEEK